MSLIPREKRLPYDIFEECATEEEVIEALRAHMEDGWWFFKNDVTDEQVKARYYQLKRQAKKYFIASYDDLVATLRKRDPRRLSEFDHFIAGRFNVPFYMVQEFFNGDPEYAAKLRALLWKINTTRRKHHLPPIDYILEMHPDSPGTVRIRVYPD
ncbi:MAG: hypothetical protein VX730_08550 [Pseudomonadota bacterium]|nr:hypothetical protein [Pseudomonadota bacterium]